MLPRSMTTFTLQQDPREPLLRKSKSPKISNRTSLTATLKSLPGENILEEARVKRRVYYKDGHHYVLGTLYCTSHRVAFRPELYNSSQDLSTQLPFDSDNDIALHCMDRILVASQSKVKVLTAQSNLKFTPEELLIYCKGFRLMHFQFRDNGAHVYRVTKAIVQSQQKSSRATQLGGSLLRSLDNRSDGVDMDFPTQMFETSADWENEIDRLGATAWRVSSVNERCDTCTSLSKYFMVPCKLLDIDLKKTFAHFNQRRVPRLCWHHPAGSDLIRSAGFHTTTDPDKDDVRSIRSLLFANHYQCVILDTSDELPSIYETQLSFTKLRSLCLNDPSLTVSDEKWLSSLEATHWLDHVRSCLKKASEISVLLSERRRSVVIQESEDRDLNCLVTSLVQVMSDPYARTLSGFQSLVQKEWISAGHPFLQRINPFKENDKEEAPVFLLFLDCVWQLLQQFSASFEFTELYLVALHDSTYNTLCSSFTHNCQWDRIRGSQHHAFSQTYTPVNGWRDVVREKILLNGEYKMADGGNPNPPIVWEWGLFYNLHQRQRFRNPMYQSRGHVVLNGNGVPDMLDASATSAVYLLSKGSLILQTPFLPWKSGTVSKRAARRAQSSENLLEEERQLRSNMGSSHCSAGLLLPLCVGPWVRLWKRCYLRCIPDVQFDVSPTSVASLAQELQLLQDKLRNQRTVKSQEHRT